MNAIINLIFSNAGQRIIAAGVAGGAAALQHKFGLIVDSATQTSISLGIYGLVHTLLDKFAPSK